MRIDTEPFKRSCPTIDFFSWRVVVGWWQVQVQVGITACRGGAHAVLDVGALHLPLGRGGRREVLPGDVRASGLALRG